MVDPIGQVIKHKANLTFPPSTFFAEVDYVDYCDPFNLILYLQKGLCLPQVLKLYGRSPSFSPLIAPVVAEVGAEYSHLGTVALAEGLKYLGYVQEAFTAPALHKVLFDRKYLLFTESPMMVQI